PTIPLPGATGSPPSPTVAMSPFYSSGHPKSLLRGSIDMKKTLDYQHTWMFDVGKNGRGLPIYSSLGHIPATYDTWSYHYEHDGLNQDAFNPIKYAHNSKLDSPPGNGSTIGDDDPNTSSDTNPAIGSSVVDQGTDGFDNDGNGIVDDPGERETSPPYPV